MQSFKLIPQLRENCIVQGKEEWLSDFEIGDIIFLISNLPTKTYSLISRIEALNYANEPKIFINSRNLGNFAENDEVTILKYNAAEAIEVHIDISTDNSIISKGDWTKNIKPSLMNKVIDLGQEISYVIPWEGGAPIIGTGIVNSTLPNPPVYIGDRTRILIDKVSNEQLSEVQKEKLRIHEERVEIIEEEIKHKTIQLIREIKHQNFPNKGRKYQFKATNPKQLFASVLTIFEELEAIEMPIEQFFDDEEQEYLASAVYINRTDLGDILLVDVQIVATGNTGNLILWVTGKDYSLISDILERYNTRISDLKQGLEQKAETLSAQCPECGGELPIKEVDVNGIVECIYCNRISKLPKALRY
ncbi:MAG: hypothetical protein ACFFCC_10660 [Promethearchaeota archaeon]